MFTVNIVCRDADDDKVILKQSSDLVVAGTAYPIVIPTIEGYTMQSVTGNETYGGTVEDFVNIVVTYKITQLLVSTMSAQTKPLQPFAFTTFRAAACSVCSSRVSTSLMARRLWLSNTLHTFSRSK